MDQWYPTMWPFYEAFIARPGVQTLVAYEEEDSAFTYGFIVADPTEQRVQTKDGAVHWWPALVLFVFVKQSYRREGIARRLFEAVGVDVRKPFLYSCNTQIASRLASKAPNAVFNPLVVRYPKDFEVRNTNERSVRVRSRRER